MKVIVDLMKCDGHDTSIEACPQVFDLRDDDNVVTVLDENPPEELRDKVYAAVRDCRKPTIKVSG
jgi:ferredoxin